MNKTIYPRVKELESVHIRTLGCSFKAPEHPGTYTLVVDDPSDKNTSWEWIREKEKTVEDKQAILDLLTLPLKRTTYLKDLRYLDYIVLNNKKEIVSAVFEDFSRRSFFLDGMSGIEMIQAVVKELIDK